MMFGTVIKCRREALGMSQNEFANLVGVSQSTISQFELGAVLSKPTYNTIMAGLDNYVKQLDRIKFLEYEIRYKVYTFEYLRTDEKLRESSYLLNSIAKLQMELMK
jgi:transcriptional regulator with XRE-family HTH domain